MCPHLPHRPKLAPLACSPLLGVPPSNHHCIHSSELLVKHVWQQPHPSSGQGFCFPFLTRAKKHRNLWSEKYAFRGIIYLCSTVYTVFLWLQAPSPTFGENNWKKVQIRSNQITRIKAPRFPSNDHKADIKSMEAGPSWRFGQGIDEVFNCKPLQRNRRSPPVGYGTKWHYSMCPSRWDMAGGRKMADRGKQRGGWSCFSNLRTPWLWTLRLCKKCLESSKYEICSAQRKATLVGFVFR